MTRVFTDKELYGKPQSRRTSGKLARTGNGAGYKLASAGKILIWIVMLSVILVYATGSINYKMNEKTISNSVGITLDSVRFQKLQKKFVVGNFEGNGKQDTIFQHMFSGKQNVELDSIPSVYENDYEDFVISWFYEQDVDLCLIFKKDTLHLGVATGLYCLINLEDLNGDKKDEIALSVDYCDWSAINSCRIYTVCDGHWTLLKQFSINERAFDFTSDTIPVRGEIKGFLEKDNGKWKYLDYLEYLEDNNSKMKLLKVGKCN